MTKHAYRIDIFEEFRCLTKTYDVKHDPLNIFKPRIYISSEFEDIDNFTDFHQDKLLELCDEYPGCNITISKIE